MTVDHFQKLSTWLNMESEAERQRLVERRQAAATNVEATGETLLDLAIDDHQIAVGGMMLLTFVKRNRTIALPWNRLRSGSPVVVSSDDDTALQHGVVSRRTPRSIQVAVDEWPEGDIFRLDLSPDERTRRVQQAALTIVAQSRGRLGELRKTLLGERTPKFQSLPDCRFVSSLNESQRAAVQFGVSVEDLGVIHGPPGTGKTTTLVELILQLVARGEKVLACAPSNTAVDNLLERLVFQGCRAVRLGHPARVAESVREHSLDALVQQHPDMNVVANLMSEAESLFRKATKQTRARPARGARQQLRSAARQLKSDARKLEQQLVNHVIDRADVICATTSLDEQLIGDRHFEWLVIDEACQATEPACWVPIMRANRLVLAGDYCQLPPTIISKQAAGEGFSKSLMERVVDVHGDPIQRRLDVQYRMHASIMEFSSQQFYEGTLVADEQISGHRLSDLSHVSSDRHDQPVLFIDTAGAGYDECQEPDGESRLNPQEGQVIVDRVQELIDIGLRPTEIAVIAPYAAQVRWLRDHCSHLGLEVDTVDGFQGREKEAVLISLVRSNESGEIGFLADTRRMNVALTRARRKLLIVGDSATLAAHDFYRQLLDYVESIDAYTSVFAL